MKVMGALKGSQDYWLVDAPGEWVWAEGLILIVKFKLFCASMIKSRIVSLKAAEVLVECNIHKSGNFKNR